MRQFDSQLIERTQRHFKRRFDMDITSEQANDYLHSLADLFFQFTNSSSNSAVAGSDCDSDNR